eukprot:5387807-Prymnesium_polylepis.1
MESLLVSIMCIIIVIINQIRNFFLLSFKHFIIIIIFSISFRIRSSTQSGCGDASFQLKGGEAHWDYKRASGHWTHFWKSLSDHEYEVRALVSQSPASALHVSRTYVRHRATTY